MNQKLFNPDYLKHLCQTYGFIPSKKYGQNFLINPEPIEQMVEAGEIKKEDIVVEVGPGFGVLTLALAEKAKKVMTFEIEKKLTPYWTDQLKENQNIEIVWGNVLREVESQQSVQSLRSYKLVANLPYQITSHLIRTFLEATNPPEVMVLMVQKEVAERICAMPGDMSVLALSVQYYGTPEIISVVPRDYFWPAPAVDSAIIKISIKNNEFRNQHIADAFFKVVKVGFVSPRKFLLKNLSTIATRDTLISIFKKLGIDEKARAEDLNIEQWQRLAQLIF